MLVRENIPTGSFFYVCLLFSPLSLSLSHEVKIPKVTTAGSARCLLPCCHEPSPSPRGSLSPLGVTFLPTFGRGSSSPPPASIPPVWPSVWLPPRRRARTRAGWLEWRSVRRACRAGEDGSGACVKRCPRRFRSVPFRCDATRCDAMRCAPSARCRAMPGARSGQLLISQRE